MHAPARVRSEEQVEDPSVLVEVAALCSALAIVATLIGLPLTLIRRTSLTGPLDALFDSFATGLVTMVVGLTLLNWLGGIWFALIVAAYLALIGATLARQGFGGLPRRARRVGAWSLATIAVLGGATLIRLRSVNYISRGGDYGAYVNWANEYARTGVLEATFPPLFAMYLGMTSRAFGFANTTATVPLLGILLLLATLRLLGQLDVHAAVRVAALLLVGLHTHAVWYSSFPMSEALQAPLVVILLSNLVAVVRAENARIPVGELVSLVTMALAIGLCRVTAPILVLPLVMLVAASAVQPWRAFTSRLAMATAATTAGVTGGYLYGISEIQPYYVGNQIGGQLPASVVDKLDQLDLLTVSPVLLGLATLGVSAFVGIAWLTRPTSRWVTSAARGPRGAGPASPDADPDRSVRHLVGRLRSWSWWPLPISVLLIVAGKVLTDKAASGDVGPQLQRIGYPLVIAAALALLVPRALRGARGLVAIFGAIVALVMVQVNVRRFDEPRDHTHYLYWDRYLFSEVFPVLVIIAALGATGLVEWSRSRWPDRPSGRASLPVVAIAAVPLLLAATTSLVTLHTVRTMNGRETLDNGYELERDIVALMPDEDRPIFWTTSTDARPTDFPFPNTWYALGVPLELSWGRDVANITDSMAAFGPELDISDRFIERVTTCSAERSIYIVEIDTGGNRIDRRLAATDLAVSKLGRVEYLLPLLRQPLASGWLQTDVVANVYEVTTAETVESAGVTCPIFP